MVRIQNVTDGSANLSETDALPGEWNYGKTGRNCCKTEMVEFSTDIWKIHE